MIQGIIQKYKANLINMLLNYTTKNSENIDVFTVEEEEQVITTVTVSRELFSSDESYQETIDTLERFGEVKRK